MLVFLIAWNLKVEEFLISRWYYKQNQIKEMYPIYGVGKGLNLEKKTPFNTNQSMHRFSSNIVGL